MPENQFQTLDQLIEMDKHIEAVLGYARSLDLPEQAFQDFAQPILDDFNATCQETLQVLEAHDREATPDGIFAEGVYIRHQRDIYKLVRSEKGLTLKAIHDGPASCLVAVAKPEAVPNS